MKTRPLLKHSSISLFIFIAVVCLFFFTAFFGLETVWGQQKTFKNADPGDCNVCHEDGKALSKNHPDTIRMNLKTCKACHKDGQAEGKKPVSLAGKIPVSHTHALGGKDCKACHGEELKPPDAGNCLACHKDYGAKKNRLNPSLPKVHDTHMGDLSCDLCHKAHGKSVNFCSQCHDWKYTVP
ncbi:MAG: cytochrome c3 family protein [Deltaproteobacteria bacterium]